MDKSKGISLIELLVVLCIIGILGLSLGFSYAGWTGRYNVERQTRDIYSDMMKARTMAMNSSRMHFVQFTGSNTYRIVEDTNENEAINAGAGDTVLPSFPKTVGYVNEINGGGIPQTFRFNSRGLITPLRTITVKHSTDPDYDCVVVSASRINMGRISGAACVQK